MQPGYHPAAFVIFPGSKGAFRLERAVGAGVSAVSDEIGCAAVEERIEHVVSFLIHFLHHPGDDDTIVVNQIEQRNGNSLLRRAGLVHHKLIGRIVAEYQAAHAPVGYLLRAWEDAPGKQVFKALSPKFQTVPARHAVHGIGALVGLVAGEDVQVSAVQINIVFRQLTEITFHIVRCLGGAEVGLAPAGPVGMFRYPAVRLKAAEGSIKGLSAEIIISVLVVDPEKVTAGMHGVGQLFHALPAAGFHAGRQIVGMLVVISGVSPAVQMEEQLFEPLFAELPDFICPDPERNHTVIFIRIFRVIHGRLLANMVFDAPVEEEASD